MNKEDIKKALVQCSGFVYCDDCPYFNRENKRCRTKLQRDALDLITEQGKEIEQLKAENIRLTTKLGQVLLSIDTVKEMNAMCNIEEQVKQAKIDVLNRLKSLSIYDDNYLDGYVFIDDIDKLLEEYENDATRND